MCKNKWWLIIASLFIVMSTMEMTSSADTILQNVDLDEFHIGVGPYHAYHGYYNGSIDGNPITVSGEKLFTINKIRANHTKIIKTIAGNKLTAITKDTDELEIDYNGEVKLPQLTIMDATLSIIDDKGVKQKFPNKSLVTPPLAENTLRVNKEYVELNNKTIKFHVNFSGLKSNSRIIFGINVVTDKGDYFYKFGYLKMPKIKPNITCTSGRNQLKGTDTIISGTATPGDTITCNLDRNLSTVVKPDGTYQLDLNKRAIGSYGQQPIVVTETDDETGGTGTATADVDKLFFKLQIDSSLIFSTESVDNFSDNDATLEWLKNKLHAQDEGHSKDQITLHLVKPESNLDLPQKLKAMGPNGQLTINVEGHNIVTGETSAAEKVTLQKVAGTVTIKSGVLNFGTLSIPAVQQYFHSQSPFLVRVNDTRLPNKGSKWVLQARMGDKMSLNKVETNNIGLVYHNTKSSNSDYPELLNNFVPIATGDAGVDKHIYVSGDEAASKPEYSNAQEADNMIFLRADSRTQVGTYTGSIEWNLSFTP